VPDALVALTLWLPGTGLALPAIERALAA